MCNEKNHTYPPPHPNSGVSSPPWLRRSLPMHRGPLTCPRCAAARSRCRTGCRAPSPVCRCPWLPRAVWRSTASAGPASQQWTPVSVPFALGLTSFVCNSGFNLRVVKLGQQKTRNKFKHRNGCELGAAILYKISTAFLGK